MVSSKRGNPAIAYAVEKWEIIPDNVIQFEEDKS
jgi:hypothetical protein